MKAKGFTLIELIVVIVVLGVLSATAAPKFVNLQSDARIESLHYLAGSVTQAADMMYAKAIVRGVESQARSSRNNQPFIKEDNGNYELKYGYPEAYADERNSLDIIDFIELSNDWEVCYSSSCTSGNSSRVKIGFDTTENTGCYVRYVEPGGTDNPSNEKYMINIVEDGC